MGSGIAAAALVELVADISPISVGKWKRMCVFSITGFENADLLLSATIGCSDIYTMIDLDEGQVRVAFRVHVVHHLRGGEGRGSSVPMA